MMAPRYNRKRRRRGAVAAAEVSTHINESSDWWHGVSHKLSTSDSLILIDVVQACPDNEEEKFKSFLRVSRKTFDYICSLVKPELEAKSSSNLVDAEGRVVTIAKQVAIALRRLVSGESQLNVGESFDVGQSTVSQVTWKFIEAMEERGIHHLRWPEANEMEEIKAKFEMIQGLPNCCGAIGTTHIVMSLPIVESSNIWHDSQENYSMILQAVVDPEMRFRDILTGLPGGINDFCILKNSGFYKLCKNGKRLNGPVKELGNGSRTGEYIVGDGGYPLLPWLLTPYQGKYPSPSKMEFNAKHNATRVVAEQALAGFKGTWRIIDGVMWRPDKHKLPRIVLVCCLLHNIIIEQGDGIHRDVLLSHHDKGYKQQLCQFADADAQSVRDNLSKYLLEKKYT